MVKILRSLFRWLGKGPGAYLAPHYWANRYWPKKGKPSPHSFFAHRYFPVLT
jgi:hypothetical protein